LNECGCYNLAVGGTGKRGGARPGAGRPPEMSDVVRLMVRLEREDLETLERLAAREGVAPGKLARQLLSAALRRRRR
jgi:hypothetical protein